MNLRLKLKRRRPPKLTRPKLGRRSSALYTAALCLLLLSAAHSFATPPQAGERARGTASGLSLSRVLSEVRRAVGYDRLKGLRRGLLLEEADTGGSGGRLLWMGPAGRFRQEALPSDARPFGFDGRFAWQVDRTGLAAPVPQRLREKLLIPAWVRSGWWLDERAPLLLAIIPEESNEREAALSLRFERGLVGAKIFVDRATWLPSRLVVEYERGPFTMTLRDYAETSGFRLPRRITVNYRGSDSESVVKSVREIEGTSRDAFAVPLLPPDTTFDNTLPAALKVAQGVPFSDSSPGHYYVRPLVDGKDVGWFHFDTGGDAMHIDTKLADELQMPVLGRSQTRGADGRPREVTIRQGKSFQLGRAIIKNPLFLAMDLSDRNAPPGEKRAGLVGYPLFARVTIEIEGGGRNISLYEPESYKLSKGRWQELSYIDLTPAVTCRFEGNREGLFQLDTGYTGTVTFYDKFTKDERLLEGRQVREETDTGAGGTYKVLRGSLEWFELAGHRFKNPRAGFRVSGYSREGGAGVVGREFLSVFRIVFDYPRRRVAFIR